MSLHMFGTTIDTVGSWVKSDGKALNGWLVLSGSLLELAHGTCLRSYRPPSASQAVEPTDGSDSA